MSREMYWDSVNSRITNNAECVPIFPTPEGIFIETYSRQLVGQPEERLSFIYSETDIKLNIVDKKRYMFLKSRGFDSCTLIRYGISQSVLERGGR